MSSQKKNPTQGGAVAGELTSDSNPLFTGTTIPRHIRTLKAFLKYGQLTREQLDGISGASNGPAIVLRLRLKGLEIPCEMREGVDQDGRPCASGVYFMTSRDRRAVQAWMAREDIA